MILLLDGDARGDAERLYWQLEPFCRDRLVNVTLSAEQDPGSLGREELWRLIREQARQQGGAVPEVGDSVLGKLSTRKQAERQGVSFPEVVAAGTRC